MISAVFLSQEKLDDEIFSYFLNYVSDESLARYKNSINKEKGRAIILGECLLKYMLSELLNTSIRDIEIIKGFGKPFCPQHYEYHLSLSHSGKIVFATISSFPIGCDVQEKKEISLKKIDCFFSEEDCNFIINNKNNELSTFYELWTRKESLTKLLGKETNCGLVNFCSHNFIHQNCSISFCTRYPIKNYVFAIATANYKNLDFLELKKINVLDIYKAYNQNNKNNGDNL